jgi:S-adenosylmethionine synthetase
MPHFEVSEGIAKGHPDKIADQISDAFLDACLMEDPSSRVAVETLISHDLVAIGGEVTTTAHLNIEEIVKDVLQDIGYTHQAFHYFASELKIVSSLCEQSPDISQSVGKRGDITHLTAGDQGMMYGYACTDTPTFMPRSYEIARTIVEQIHEERDSGRAYFLGIDGKTQVAIDLTRKDTGSVIVSWQHSETTSLEEVRATLSTIIQKVTEKHGFHTAIILINPSGRFVLGGPLADTGLTGRKQIVDSYGSSVRHGGGAYSGKDATKVDRSGAYMARYVAKHVVAADLATHCEVQLIYSIGLALPLNIGIDCFGTEKVSLAAIEKAIRNTFDFSVGSIIQELQLMTPFFRKTAFGGHFGREEFPWEKLPRIKDLQRSL